MVGYMLGYSCCLHPFFQHHFYSCRCDCQVVEDVVYAFFSFRHPLLCFFRQGDGYSILGFDLDMVNVFCLTVSSLVDFTPVQGFHVAISQTSETGEQKGFLHQFITAWCVHHLLYFLYRQKLTLSHSLLWLLLCLQQQEWILLNQSVPYCTW